MFLRVRKSVIGVLFCFCEVLILGISCSVVQSSSNLPELLDDGKDQLNGTVRPYPALQCLSSFSFHLSNLFQPAFELSGLIPAILTSLHEDQSVNLEVIPSYVDYLINNGIKAVLVGGSSGEHMALTLADRKRLIDAWVQASSSTQLHIHVQIGGAPFPDVVHLAKYCAEIGVDSLLTLPDLYTKPKTVNELVDYVELISNAAPNLPLVYYHIPKKTFVNINMPKFVQAASMRIKNFKGIKYTGYDLVEASQVLRVLRKDQRIFLGGEHLLAPAAVLGIDSCMSPAINLFPGLMQNILDAVRNNDITTASDQQATLSRIVNDISAEGGRIPAMKIGMEYLTGMEMGPPALPTKIVPEENRSKIEDIFKSVMGKLL